MFRLFLNITTLLIFLLVDGKAFADEISKGDYLDSNIEPSYISFSSGRNFGNSSNSVGKLVFETDINRPFRMIEHSFSKYSFKFTVTPKVLLRMYRENSSPVKTPSFMPRAKIYFFKGKFDSKLNKNENFFYSTLMLSHHSNGQAGSFYDSLGIVNTETGSFSTNFFELAFHGYFAKSFLPAWNKVALEWHPGFNRSSKLDDQYEDLKVSYSFRNQPRKLAAWKGWNFKFYTKLSYILSGKKYKIAPVENFPAIASKKAKFSDKFHWTSKLSFKVPKIDLFQNDIHFFFQYDLGPEYYNIHFQKNLSRFQFGLAADASSFVNPKNKFVN